MKKHRMIKKIFFSIAVLFCILILAYKAFFYFDRRSEQHEIALNKDITRLTPDEMAKLQEGDIILRRGFGFFSDYISENLNDGGAIDVTHAGILVRRNGSFHVIHSLSSDVTKIDGMQIQPLETFLEYSTPGKIIVTRAKNADAATGSKVAKLAEAYLGRHIPFDHNGKFDDCTELFCTELVWQILEKDLHCIRIPTEPKARKSFFYSMVPMYSTDYFDIKINQFGSAKQ